MIDTTTKFGQRVARRLAEERIAWLTTVDSSGVPQPRPIWFLWDGATFLLYSRPGTAKLRHIVERPQVALHLDGDGLGGDIVVFTGQATVDPAAPPADQLAAYAAKYQPGFARIGMTAAEFAASYSVAVRVTPLKLRGH
ncbi:MAG TPA: TIGR03667 family PPOX class F420-dependent oxidoreductase [Anaerolineae bacterium]|nr:TIGR03667 family PPOX class F420-dependent oxidoreductase [Anaerolineae bacterium]